MKRKVKQSITRIICFALILSMLSQSGMSTVTASAGNVATAVAVAAEQAAQTEAVTSADPTVTTELPEGQETTTVSSGDADEAAEPEILHEIEENRGEFSKEYLLSDNSRTLVVYPEQIHYETADGKLSEIDNSLIKTEEGYKNGSNSYELLITDNGESRGEVIYREDAYEISWQMVELVGDDAEAEEPEEEGAEETPVETPASEAADSEEPAEGIAAGVETTEDVSSCDVSTGDVSLGDTLPEEMLDSTQNTFEKEKDRAENKDASESEENSEDKDRKQNKEKTGKKENKGNKENKSEKHHKKQIHIPYLTATVTEEVADAPFMEEEAIHRPRQSAVTFEGYKSGVSVEYAPTGDGVKENIILSSRESGNEYIFRVQMSGLKARLTTCNEVEFYDEDTDEVMYYFPAPFMIDSKGEVSYEARYELIDSAEISTDGETETDSVSGSDASAGGNSAPAAALTDEDICLKIVLDEQWLSTASYPVTVDPVLKQARAKNLLDYGSVGGVVPKDTEDAEDTEGTETFKNDTLYVGKKGDYTYRSFIKFELPDMEKQSIISEAMLYFDGTASGSTHYIQAHMVTECWHNKMPLVEETVPTFGGKETDEETGAVAISKELTWATQPKTAHLLDYSLSNGKFNITKAVRKWLAGELPNYGIAFTAYDETNAIRATMKLKNSAASPYLKITYRTATGLEDYWGTHAVGAGSAGAGYISDYTGALTVVNADVITAGNRFPLSIGHVYNSNTTEEGNGWRLNYDQTIKIPLDTVDITTYPYVYTDEDGTEHYFKKADVTYLENGASKKVLGSATIPSARDEDGLDLYIVPVNNADLKEKYPLKLIDKSGSVVKYFDTMGRLAMITDSNQYENGKNSSTKEKNAVTINYEAYGEAVSLTAYDEAIAAAQAYYDICCDADIAVSAAEHIEARGATKDAIDTLKTDAYATVNYKTAKQVNTAAVKMSSLTDTTSTVSKATAKSTASAILTALKEAKKLAEPLTVDSTKRIESVTDAVGNKAVFTYDGKGRISTISDPTYGEGRVNSYSYDTVGNLTQITFASGKNAYYTYKAGHLLTSQQDNDGYKVTYTYREADDRVTMVSESHGNTPGQTYSITYNTDNTTTFRFSGADDVYETNDDIQNIHVFDEQGRAVCIYSKSVSGNDVLGATACTYLSDKNSDGTENVSKRNKLKDVAVVGMHTNNLLKNHSFEYSDSTWTMYKNSVEKSTIDGMSRHSTVRKYIGSYSAYINLSKQSKAVNGFKQTVKLAAGTYTLSGYCKTVGIKNAAAYLKVTDEGENTYYSNKITQVTDAEFDNGWQRLEVTFTIDSEQTVTVHLETDTGTLTGAGNAAFDCIQLETGDVANDYNILEDGSFELTEETVPYKWKNLDNSTIKVKDERVEGVGVDGDYCYHITGQPGKDKYLKFTTNLGSAKNSFVLSGWIKTDTTPIRSGRALKAVAYHKEETEEATIELKVTSNINAYSEGWKYFCMIIPAEKWKSTTFTLAFYDNIGDLYIDGLQLTRNDVQTKKYDSSGRITSSYTTQKSTAYTYDIYNRLKTQTTPAGAKYTYTYSKTNDVSKVAASIGPDTYYKYDRYGNQTTSSTYNPDSSTKPTLYTETTYTEDGNFVKTETDNAGNVTSYEYNPLTGQLLKTTLPERNTATVTLNQYAGARVEDDFELAIDAEAAEDAAAEATTETDATEAESESETDAETEEECTTGEDSTEEESSDEESSDEEVTDSAEDTGTDEAFADNTDVVSNSIVEINYTYDEEDRISKVTQGKKSVSYEYGEFDDLTGINHNGFSYNYTYDEFGNVLTISRAGTTICTNEYALYNGQLIRSTYPDGTVIGTTYDAYGRIASSSLDGNVITKYVYDNDGNVARKTDVLGNVTTKYDYNDSNLLVRSEVYSGDSTASEDLQSRMQYTYTKSGKVGTLSYQEKDDDVRTYTYTYAKDEKPVKSTLPDGSYTNWTYDSLRRNTKIIHTPKSGAADGKKLYTTLKYHSAKVTTADGTIKTVTTGLVKEYLNKFGSSGKAVSKFAYTYDSWGNITKIVDKVATADDTTGIERNYVYDDYGEVIYASEDYRDGTSATYSYIYDDGGNILTERINGVTHTYTYDDTWKDKLIAYDGKPITYDVFGCPTDYMGTAMTWDIYGGLTTIAGGTDTITYTYTGDGQRSTKTVNGVTTTYHYNNGMLLSETIGDETTGVETLRYYYDSTGKVTSVVYKKADGTENGYFYARNGQGDIIAIYRSKDSKLIGTYEYDLWGRPISVTEATEGIDTDGILAKNPFRYRGYYYDNETGFYYLTARYYDPEIRRFISADDIKYLGIDGSPLSYNLFAYCMNTPVNMIDPTGNYPKLSTIFTVVAVSAVVVAAVAATVATCGAAAPALAVVGGGVIGGISAGAASVATGATVVAGVATAAAVTAAVAEKTVEKTTKRNNTVYALKDGAGTVQYVGRTCDLERRKKAHEANPARAGLEMEILASGLNYPESRALEQAGMAYHHTINTANKMNNQINSVAPKYWDAYKEVAIGTLKYGWNQMTNEILYWTKN